MRCPPGTGTPAAPASGTRSAAGKVRRASTYWIDLVQVLGDAQPGAALAVVFGHPLADVRDHPSAPVPQGDVPLDVPLQKDAAAALQAEPRRYAAAGGGVRRG